MRTQLSHAIERGRQPGTTSKDGLNGIFRLRPPVSHAELTVIASDGYGWEFEGEPWEHVSVSLPKRCPTWDEMTFIRLAFWRDDETVMQLHAMRSDHINVHPFCLHLWRPTGEAIPMPPRGCV